MATLGIFMKHPLPGRVKTRLGARIGDAAAAQIYAGFLHDLLARSGPARSGLADVRRVIAYAPDEAASRAYFEQWSGAAELWPQPESGLGERLIRFFDAMLSEGEGKGKGMGARVGPVVVIGSDSPTIPLAAIRQAFDALAERDVVLGPAFDGGYYLVGQSRPLPEMFERIDWSGPDVLTQTLERLKESGRSLSLLSPWYDVDGLEDLRFLKGHLAAMKLAGEDADFPHRTWTLLEALLSESE